jgi:hypothetical protein
VFPSPYMGQLQWNTNLPGSDVSNIDNVEVNTAGECSNECQRDDRCKAMTFVKHQSAPGGVCWLKDEVPGKGDTFGYEMVSAVRVFPGIFGIEW